MALKKDVNYKGFTLSYWIITRLMWDKSANVTSVEVKGYKDKPQRDEDLNNCIEDLTQVYDVKGSISIDDAYKALKEQTLNASYLGTDGIIPFKDAEDC